MFQSAADETWNNGWTRWHSGKGNYTYDAVKGRIGAGDANGDGVTDIIGLCAASELSLAICVWRKQESDNGFDFQRDIWNSENIISTDSAATTLLVDTMTNGSDTLGYTYDEPGNITSISENGEVKVTYQYDGRSQLIREDHVGGETYVYAYDNGGNILSRKAYPYTPAESEPDAEQKTCIRLP